MVDGYVLLEVQEEAEASLGYSTLTLDDGRPQMSMYVVVLRRGSWV